MQNNSIQAQTNTSSRAANNSYFQKAASRGTVSEGFFPRDTYKIRRQQKIMYKILINETVSGLLKILESNHKAALKLEQGVTSLAEEFKNKGIDIYQQLNFQKHKNNS